MKIDISKLGYRWKGLYGAGESYVKGDVVRKDNKVQHYNGTAFEVMGSGQLNAENKGELLNAGTSLNLTGKAGQQLVVQGDGSMAWEHTEGRHGTTVKKMAITRNRWGGRPNGSGCYALPHQNMGFIMTDGTVRITGRGNEGQHGVGNTNDYSRSLPVQAGFEPGVRITDLYAQHHGGGFYAIDSDGQLWSWGNDNYGQLGRDNPGDTGDIQLVSGQGDLPRNDKVIRVGVFDLNWYGYQAAWCKTENGRIYTWGSNRYGCLMHETEDFSTAQVNTPKLVPLSTREDITEFYGVGDYYSGSFACTADGRLFTAGEHNTQIRMSPGNGSYSFPKLWTPSIEYPVKLVTYEGSDSHAVADNQYYRAGAIVTEGDLLWTWGHRNKYNSWTAQVNNDSTYSSETWAAKKWSTITNVKYAHNTSGHYHTQIVMKKDGSIWGLGYDGGGIIGGNGDSHTAWVQLGLGTDNEDVWMGGARYGKVAYVKKTDGRIIWWGRTRHGIGGVGRSDNGFNTEAVRLNKTITDVELCGYHYDDTGRLGAFYLTEDGTVYACGDNDYGKLGMDDDHERIHTPTPVLF